MKKQNYKKGWEMEDFVFYSTYQIFIPAFKSSTSFMFIN